jgi:histone acetyltransferase 1
MCVIFKRPYFASHVNSHLSAGLYAAIYQLVLSRPDVVELTVEDPAEAFEDLRDRNDLKMLLSNEQFMREGFGEGAVSHGGGKVKRSHVSKSKGKGKLGPPAHKGWMEKWRKDLKIAGVSNQMYARWPFN